MPIELMPTPYQYHALDPVMSEETLAYHHGKHHKGYVDNLNALIGDTKLEDEDLVSIILVSNDVRDSADIFNNAAQVWNHDFFWNSMRPDGGGTPNSELQDRIAERFGDMNAFTDAFREKATGHFGSGWIWLVSDEGDELDIVSTPNAVPPIVDGLHPLLACDVWEHAYYIDYRNDRGKFVDAFLDYLVNWDFAAKQLDLISRERTPLRAMA